MKITLLGGGLGNPDTLTLAAWKALQNAQVLVGARRVLESLPKELTGERYPEIAPQKIVSRLKQAMEEGKTEACVVLSGDVGFYSGARKLLPLLDFGPVEVLPGLSSPQYLASRLGMPWQDYHLVSAHGLGEDQVDPVGEVRCYPETFFLTGGQFTPQSICRRLVQEGLGHLPVTVGENLSYPEETITRGRAEELAEREFEPLSVMLVENPRPAPLCLTGGLPPGKRPHDKAVGAGGVFGLPVSWGKGYPMGCGSGYRLGVGGIGPPGPEGESVRRGMRGRSLFSAGREQAPVCAFQSVSGAGHGPGSSGSPPSPSRGVHRRLQGKSGSYPPGGPQEKSPCSGSHQRHCIGNGAPGLGGADKAGLYEHPYQPGGSEQRKRSGPVSHDDRPQSGVCAGR